MYISSSPILYEENETTCIIHMLYIGIIVCRKSSHKNKFILIQKLYLYIQS